MEGDGKVVRLIDRACGIRPDDTTDLCDWAQSWLNALGKGEYGQIRSLAIIVERDDGKLGLLSQSVVDIDRARLIGLLHIAAHSRADGGAQIESLKED